MPTASDIFEGIKEYGRSLKVSQADLASYFKMSKKELANYIDNADEDEYERLVRAMDDIAKRRIIDNSPIASETKPNKIDTKRYKEYRKHNSEIIDYMLIHSVSMSALIKEFKSRHFGVNIGGILKREKLTQVQVQEVLRIIDEIEEHNPLRIPDDWGIWGARRINTDVKGYMRTMCVTQATLAQKIGLTPKQMKIQLNSGELPNDTKEKYKKFVYELSPKNPANSGGDKYV